jgi:hypothetical protein
MQAATVPLVVVHQELAVRASAGLASVPAAQMNAALLLGTVVSLKASMFL